MIYVYRGTLRGKVKFSQDAGKRAQKESFGRRCGCGEKGRNYVKSLENLSEHFLNSAFARLAYYFYGSRERTESAHAKERERERERERETRFRDSSLYRSRKKGVGSISNMLINDPFERWIGGVEFVRILFRRRRPTFECQKESRNAPVLHWRFSDIFLIPSRTIAYKHIVVIDPRLIIRIIFERNARNYVKI